jgi:hypothetical protein
MFPSPSLTIFVKTPKFPESQSGGPDPRGMAVAICQRTAIRKAPSIRRGVNGIEQTRLADNCWTRWLVITESAINGRIALPLQQTFALLASERTKLFGSFATT